MLIPGAIFGRGSTVAKSVQNAVSSKALQQSMAANVAKGTAMGAVEGASVQYYMNQIDGQGNAGDVLMAAVLSGTFAGGVTAAGLGIGKLRNKDLEEFNLKSQEDLNNYRLATAEADKFESRVKRDPSETNSKAVSRALVEEELELKSKQARTPEEVAILRKREAELSTKVRRQKEAAGKASRKKRKAIHESLKGHNKKLGEVKAEIKEHNLAVKAKEDLKQMERGVVPAELKGRIAEVEAQVRGRDTLELRQAIASLKQKHVDKDTTEQKTLSVGAARSDVPVFEDVFTIQETTKAYENLDRVAETASRVVDNTALKMFGKKGARRYIQSAYTTFNESASNFIRGFGGQLAADPQMNTKGVTNAGTTSQRVYSQLINLEGGREAQAVAMYAAEMKLSKLETLAFTQGEGALRKEFDNKVTLAHTKGIDFGSEAIALAAQARSETLQVALGMKQEVGVGGFDKAKAVPQYWPMLPHLGKMQESTNKLGREAVVAVLEEAYATGKRELSRRSARIVANAQYERTMSRGLVHQEKKHSLADAGNRAILEADLRKAGVDDAQIKSFIEELDFATEQVSVSSRARFSLFANMGAEVNGLRLVDVIDTSPDVVKTYARETAGDVAIARQGYATRRELESTIRLAEETDKNITHDIIAANNARIEALNRERAISKSERRAEIDKEILELNREIKKTEKDRKSYQEDYRDLGDFVKMLYHESIDAVKGKTSKLVQTSRAMRKLQNVWSLGNLGFAVVGEHANLIVRHGLGVYLKAFPPSATFGTGYKTRSAARQEIESLAGAWGSRENELLRNDYALRNTSEADSDGILRLMDKGLSKAEDVTGVLSFFKSLQRTGENISINISIDKLQKAAMGKRKYNKHDLQELYSAGLSPESLDSIFKYMRSNFKKNEDGSITSNLAGMPPELRHELGDALRAVWSRDMQRAQLGETSVWSNTELGKVMLQYRGYSLLAIEKQLIAGASHRPVVLALQAILGSALATLAYSARSYLQSLREKDPEQAMYDKMHPDAVLRNVSALSPHLSLLGLGFSLADTTGVNTNVFEPDRPSPAFVTAAGISSAPIASGVDRILGAPRASGSFLGDLVRGDLDDSSKERYGNRLSKLLPFTNTAAVSVGIGALKAMQD